MQGIFDFFLHPRDLRAGFLPFFPRLAPINLAGLASPWRPGGQRAPRAEYPENQRKIDFSDRLCGPVTSRLLIRFRCLDARWKGGGI